MPPKQHGSLWGLVVGLTLLYVIVTFAAVYTINTEKNSAATNHALRMSADGTEPGLTPPEPLPEGATTCPSRSVCTSTTSIPSIFVCVSTSLFSCYQWIIKKDEAYSRSLDQATRRTVIFLYALSNVILPFTAFTPP